MKTKETLEQEKKELTALKIRAFVRVGMAHDFLIQAQNTLIAEQDELKSIDFCIENLNKQLGVTG